MDTSSQQKTKTMILGIMVIVQRDTKAPGGILAVSSQT